MTDEDSSVPDDRREDELRERISLFLRRNFPQIRMHGGDAVIQDLDPDEGTVTIQLSGACSGCGLSPMTIQALKDRMTKEIPEITEVYANTGMGNVSSSPSSTGGGPSRGGGSDSSPNAPF